MIESGEQLLRRQFPRLPVILRTTTTPPPPSSSSPIFYYPTTKCGAANSVQQRQEFLLWKICKLLSGWAVIHEADNVPKYPPAPLPPSYYIAPKESTHHSVSKKSFFSPALTTVWTKCFENICKFISAMASQLPPGHPVPSVQNTQQHKDVSKSTDCFQDLLLSLDERIVNVSCRFWI